MLPSAYTIVRRGGLKVRDRDLRVCHAKSDTAPSKKNDESRRDIKRRKFSAISDKKSSWKDGKKPKASAASLSYQGMRSSKSGEVKKSRLGPHPVGYEAKKAAVAARKQKQLAKKRKMEKGTLGYDVKVCKDG